MLDYAFLEILETLSIEEIKSFRRFVSSPYFNRSGKVIKLLDVITKYHPNYDNRLITKERLHKKISPDLPYNETTMRRLLFDLQNLAEKFMKQLQFEKRKAESGIFLIEELAGRGTSKMYYKNSKSTKKILDSTGSIDSDTCLNRFRLDTDDFYFGMINNKINKKNFVNTEANRLISGITYLISFFMLEAIKHNDTLLAYSQSFNVKYNEKFINQFIQLFDFERLEIFMRANKMVGGHLIEVYLNTLKAFLYFENEQYYHNFKKSLFDYKDELSPSDNHFLFIRLEGYCILKNHANAGKDGFYNKELFDIYRTVLENKYYESEGNKYITVDLFRNVLINSTRVRDLKWMEEFITEYGRYLHPNRQKDILNYSNALLEFERNSYDQSLNYLSRIKMEEFTYHLDMRNLYLKLYYDRQDYDTAFAFARSFRKYLNENTLVSEENKLKHENFIKYIVKLINFHNSATKTDLTSLKMQISKCKKLDHKDWLLGKIHSLDKTVRRAI